MPTQMVWCDVPSGPVSPPPDDDEDDGIDHEPWATVPARQSRGANAAAPPPPQPSPAMGAAAGYADGRPQPSGYWSGARQSRVPPTAQARGGLLGQGSLNMANTRQAAGGVPLTRSNVGALPDTSAAGSASSGSSSETIRVSAGRFEIQRALEQLERHIPEKEMIPIHCIRMDWDVKKLGPLHVFLAAHSTYCVFVRRAKIRGQDQTIWMVQRTGSAGEAASANPGLNSDVLQALQKEVNAHTPRCSKGDNELRQFGCQTCGNLWWRRVPQRKPVARCKGCQVKYGAVPRSREWGYGKFVCGICASVWTSWDAKGNVKQFCVKCIRTGRIQRPDPDDPSGYRSAGGGSGGVVLPVAIGPVPSKETHDRIMLARRAREAGLDPVRFQSDRELQECLAEADGGGRGGKGKGGKGRFPEVSLRDYRLEEDGTITVNRQRTAGPPTFSEVHVSSGSTLASESERGGRAGGGASEGSAATAVSKITDYDTLWELAELPPQGMQTWRLMPDGTFRAQSGTTGEFFEGAGSSECDDRSSVTGSSSRGPPSSHPTSGGSTRAASSFPGSGVQAQEWETYYAAGSIAGKGSNTGPGSGKGSGKGQGFSMQSAQDGATSGGSGGHHDRS
eukprot:TRINITY_DN30557_c0_g2_i1.p1 TRINITY_DN30557_c0_g2~~TRINITY_DN30557_c0_g2_i1.p1  ORF type:complete len:619 (+),score=91.17 TRINITY_DN30557_c0_g2_i1:120-1976(+)